MQINPYLFYDGQCEAAFNFYEQAIGAKIEAMMRVAGSPAEDHMPPESRAHILHAQMIVDGEVVMASDSPKQLYEKPQGFAVCLNVQTAEDGKRKFDALSAGGNVVMPYGPTFFSPGHGMCVDRFGIPWMVNTVQECPGS